MKEMLLGLALVLAFMANARVDISRARIELLEAKHKEVIIENIFLARKLGESVHENKGRFVKIECQTDLASAGFRSGHWRARRMMIKPDIINRTVIAKQFS